VAISFVPWIPTVLADNQISDFWIQKPNIYFLVEYVYMYLGGDIFLGIVYLLLTGLFFRYLVNYLKKHTIAHLRSDKFILLTFILLCWIIFSYLVPYLKSLFSTPVMHVRYTLITLPALLVVFSLGWRLIPKQNIRLLIIGLIAISTVVNMFLVKKYYYTTTRMQFRELIQDLIQQNTESTKVYSDGAWYFNYYLDHYNAGFQAFDTYGRKFEDELANEKAIWILYSISLEGATPEQMQYLRTHYTPKKKIKYFQAEAVLYERKD
jgi:hypothetical protein